MDVLSFPVCCGGLGGWLSFFVVGFCVGFFHQSDLFMHCRGVSMKSCLGTYKAQGVEGERNQSWR